MNSKLPINPNKKLNSDKIKTISDEKKSFKIEFEGTRKDIVIDKKEKEFNQTQLKQIAEIFLTILNDVVQPMIKALKDNIIERLEKIESCQTIAKELQQLENNKKQY